MSTPFVAHFLAQFFSSPTPLRFVCVCCFQLIRCLSMEWPCVFLVCLRNSRMMELQLMPCGPKQVWQYESTHVCAHFVMNVICIIECSCKESSFLGVFNVVFSCLPLFSFFALPFSLEIDRICITKIIAPKIQLKLEHKISTLASCRMYHPVLCRTFVL